jgi:hypothetical protein
MGRTYASEHSLLQVQSLIGNRVVSQRLVRERGWIPTGILQRQTAPEEAQFTDAAPVAVNTAAQAVHLDTAVGERLEEFLAEFQGISVHVRWTDGEQVIKDTVTVHPPYFMNLPPNAKHDTRVRYERAIANRRVAERDSENKSQVARRQDWVGKGTPESIAAILQEAVDNNRIAFDRKQQNYPSADDMRQWLIKFGIGIDCSGFVVQALNAVMAELYGQEGIPAEESPNLNVRNFGSGSLKGGTRQFTRVEQPKDLRPGDTMWSAGHIRIVTSVMSSTTNIEFETAESTPGPKLAPGEPGSLGPTGVRWRYSDPEHFRLLEQQEGDRWKRVKKAFTFGRYRALTAFENQYGNSVQAR